MKICPVRAELFHADLRKDGHSFASASKQQTTTNYIQASDGTHRVILAMGSSR
jgi:hypothetical protein